MQKPKAVAKGRTAPPTPGSSAKFTVIVSCTGEAPEGMEILIGQYEEAATNHGRKTFKRKQVGAADSEVQLYYWDTRDGADNSGWWLGESVGGDQVYARCESAESNPPKTGWRVPWDGDVSDLACELRRPSGLAAPKAPVAKAPMATSAPASKSGGSPRPPSLRPPSPSLPPPSPLASPLSDFEQDEGVEKLSPDERFSRASDRVSIVEMEANQALESAKAMIASDEALDSLKGVEDLLSTQQTALTDANKALSSDIMDARKSCPKAVTQMSKLPPRLRTCQQQLMQEVQSIRKLLSEKKKEHDQAQLRAQVEEKQLQAEQRDAKLLEEALPEAMDIVTAAEDTIDMVINAAQPLQGDASEDADVSAAIKETEAAVSKASAAIKVAKTQVTTKIQAAKGFAPEAQKVALAEFSALQEKVAECQKRIAPYVNIRKDWQDRLAARKIMSEIADKLGKVENEVDKLVGSVPEGKISAETIKAAESGIPAVTSAHLGAMKLIDQRLATASGMLKEDLLQMKDRGKETKEKLDTFRTRLRTEADQAQLKVLVEQCQEKTQAAEAALEQTTVAETPFLKGIEGLPADETAAAIAACVEAGVKAEGAASQAKAFLKTKLAEVRRFAEASRKTTMEELTALQARADAVATKVSSFKQETHTRKTQLQLQEATEKVLDAENKLAQVTEAAKPCTAENLEEVAVDVLKEGSEKTLELEKATALAVAEAKKVISAKQKDGPKDSPLLSTELSKLNTRLTTVQTELQKARKSALAGEKMYKCKQIIQEKEVEMEKLEAEFERVEIMTTPVGDENPSDEAIAEMVTAVDALQKSLTEATKALTSAVLKADTATLKEKADKLLARAKEIQVNLDEVKAQTKEQSDRVQCEQLLKEGRAKLAKLDEAFERTSEAEGPYLKGLDVLPTDVATKAVADSEAAIEVVQKIITDNRTYLASKTAEIKKFCEGVSKPGLEEVTSLNAKVEEATKKLSAFKSETEGRKRQVLLQDATDRVKAAEEAVSKCVEAAAPLTSQNAEEISPDDAQIICDKLGEADKEAQSKLDDARKFLTERQRDKKGANNLGEISKLLSRTNSIQVELAKARAAGSNAEQKFVAKILLSEVAQHMEDLEAGVEKATGAAAPLLEEGGKMFIVASMTKMIVSALTEHMNQKSLTKEDLWKMMNDGAADSKVTEAEFVAFLSKVPEMCSRPDTDFSPEQRAAIFEQVDDDADSALTQANFFGMFKERYICSAPVSLTDAFDVAEGRTLEKLAVDDVVEAMGESRTSEAGITRMEVKTSKDGTSGWVTLTGNQGTTYLEPFTTYASFMKDLEKSMLAAQTASAKASQYINTKSNELKTCKEGPLFDAKDKLSKLRPKVSVMQAKLDQLKKRIEEGKKEHQKREDFEKRKRQEAKDRKAAQIILKVITENVQKADAALQNLVESAAPLTVDGEAELLAVEKPLSVRKAAHAVAKEVLAAVAASVDHLKAPEERVSKAVKGPWFEAKQEMAKLQDQLSAIEAKASGIHETMNSSCDSIAAAAVSKVSGAMRESLQKRSITVEACFKELAGKDADHIAEDKLDAHLKTLSSLTFHVEHKTLLFGRLTSASTDTSKKSIGRRQFFQMLERYYECVKAITFTSKFTLDEEDDGNKRKVEVGEILEVLEGPRTDEGGMSRVRARAVTDGSEGWITVKGNQGTPFLQETHKPCFFVVQPIVLQDGFASEGSADLRELLAHEVIEVLEGPKKEIIGTAIRAKAKTSDGLTGWFTLTSSAGVVNAQHSYSVYTTISAIALTDNQDIKACKVVRKLRKDEELKVIEGPVTDDKQSVTRIKVIAKKDSKEGWVTVKGNAGTSYCEETGKFYVVSRAVPLQHSFPSDSAQTARMLAEGEALELIEGPKEEKTEPALRVRGRTVSDGKIGWVTLKGGNLKPWVPRYRCINGTGITDVLEVEKAEPVRRLADGEIFEVLQGPDVDGEAGIVRVRGRAEQDGAVGWVTIAGNQGTQFLECAADNDN